MPHVAETAPVAANRGRTARGAALAGLALIVFALALACIVFTREIGRVAAIWPINAVIVAVLLRSERGTWGQYLVAGLLGNVGANLVTGDAPFVALELAACNGVEVLLCAGLMRRWAGSRIDLGQQKHLILFTLIGGGAAPLASAAAAAVVLSIAGGGVDPQTLFGWWAADALGLLIVAPALLALTPEAMSALGGTIGRRKGLASISVLTVCLVSVFGQNRYPLFFMIPPALIMVAFELNLAGAALALLGTSAVAVVMTLTGHGPATLIHGGLSERLRVLELFLATLTVSVLPVAAALAKRGRLEDALRTSLSEIEAAQRLTNLAQDIAGVGHWRLDRATGRSQWSEQTFSIFGLSRAEFATRADSLLDFYHPDDEPLVRGTIQRAFTDAEPFALKVRFHRLTDGAERTVVFKGEAERAADGEAEAIFGVVRDVTDEETTRTRIEDSEARFRLLAESAIDVVLKVDADDHIQYVSPSMRRYGYEPEDLIGQKGASFIHPDDLREVLTRLAAVTAGAARDRFADRSYRMRKADGGYVWMESNSTAITDQHGRPAGVIAHMRDVTERRAANAALAESELRHRLIAESATDIISRMSVNGRVTYFSPSVTDITGHTVAEVTGASMIHFLHPDDVEPTLQAYRTLFAGGLLDAPLAYRVRHKDGRWVWLEGSPTLVRDPHGAPLEVIDVRRDVTARVRLEADLRAARDAAEDVAAVKSAFMANMSHEIRTPLTAILGFTSLLAGRPGLDGVGQTHLSRIAGAGQALLAIVNDILDFSALEAGHVEIAPAPAAPAELLNEALLMFSPKADEKGLALRFVAEASVPPCVSIDPNRLRQIALNLIGNAIKFTDAGQIRLLARYDAETEQLGFSVEDTGAGMSEAQQEKLFQRFSQVDASSTRRHGGTGLGLAISKGLAEAMGGQISVRSALGRGSSFDVRVAAPVATFSKGVGPTDPAASIDGMRVLIADDSPFNRELVRTILVPLGAEVTDAVDGPDAVEIALSAPFDLILMDIHMAGLDGSDAAARIRAEDGPNQGVPILAFTADAEPSRFEAGKSVFDGVVRKPLTPDRLIAALSQSLRWDDSVGAEATTPRLAAP